MIEKELLMADADGVPLSPSPALPPLLTRAPTFSFLVLCTPTMDGFDDYLTQVKVWW
jgi:hypothetical protein